MFDFRRAGRRSRGTCLSYLFAPIFVAWTILQVSPCAQAQMVRLNARGRVARIPEVAALAQWEADQPRPVREVLIKLKPGVSPKFFAQRFSAGFAIKQPLRQRLLEGPGSQVPNQAPLEYTHTCRDVGWHVFRLPSPGVLAETLAELRQQPDVLYAEPNQAIRLLRAPPTNPRWSAIDDERIYAQLLINLGLQLDGTPRDYDSAGWHYNWTLETVNAEAAWTLYPGSYPTAAQRLAMDPARLPLVAILDTGLDMAHPGFTSAGGASPDVADGGAIATNLARSFFNGARGTDPQQAMDVFGHGTSVAGVIGAAPNNGLGIPGLGFMCRIVPVRIYGDNGDGNDSDMVDAITYATDAGCLLINISARTDLGYSAALKDAVDYAWVHNTLVIAASGNDGSATAPDQALIRRYPASLGKVLSVGATAYGGGPPGGSYVAPSTNETIFYTGTSTQQEFLASYSNSGISLGVVAPAGDSTNFDNVAPLTGDDLWQALLLASGIPDGTVPEFPLTYTTAPTYLVPLSDPNNAAFGGYAQQGFYGLNYGAIPGTSFACPQVVGLAALYASKNGITQATPNAPQRILQAIQRGADNLSGRSDGGFDLTYGWGRINALATLQDLNERNATVGGVVGTVSVGGTIVANVRVRAQNTATGATIDATTTEDGVYHLINLLAGQWTLTASALGYSDTLTLNVQAGCDVQAADFRLNEVVLTLSPLQAYVPYGGQYQFSASVSGTSDKRVFWSLESKPSGTTISQAGLLAAPSAAVPGEPDSALVKVQSLADGTKQAFAVVTFFTPVTISGTVMLQGLSSTAPPQTVDIEFRPKDGAPFFTRQVQVDATGDFSLEGIPGKRYDVAIKGSKWLRKVIAVDTTAGNVSGLAATLLAGDINGDNVVSLVDSLLLNKAFGSRSNTANWNPLADLNGDGTVSLLDSLLLKNNFGKRGDP